MLLDYILNFRPGTYKSIVLVFVANFLLQRLEPSSLAQFHQHHIVIELSHSAVPPTVKLNHIPVLVYGESHAGGCDGCEGMMRHFQSLLLPCHPNV